MVGYTEVIQPLKPFIAVSFRLARYTSTDLVLVKTRQVVTNQGPKQAKSAR